MNRTGIFISPHVGQATCGNCGKPALLCIRETQPPFHGVVYLCRSCITLVEETARMVRG